MSRELSFLPHLVRGQRGEPLVLDGAPHCEVVEALPVARRDAEHIVNEIIEVAPDPGRTDARLFRFEVQHVADKTGLPEEISIERSAVGHQAAHVIRDHPEAEGPIPRDVLAAGKARSLSAVVPFFEQVQGKATRADGGRRHRNSCRIA
jgi:hypothetical protein